MMNTDNHEIPENISPKRKKRKSKPFATGFSELDSIYHKTRDELFSDGLKPTVYFFDEKNLTHTLTCFEKIRFTKKEGSRAVMVEYRTSSDKEWKTLSLEEAYDEALPYEQRPRVLASALSPVMWPVLHSNASFVRHFPSLHTSSFRQSARKLQDFMASETFENDNFQKKFNQLHAVLSRISRGDTVRFRMKNVQSNVKVWWTHFVDREVLKACVAVEGKNSASRISWVDYAVLTQQPRLDAILQHVKSLGVLSPQLSMQHPNTWLEKTPKDFLSPAWQKIWKDVEVLPVSVQRGLAQAAQTDRHFHHNYAAKHNEIIPPWMSASPPPDVPLVWSIFTKISKEFLSKDKLLPRQQNLILQATESLFNGWEVSLFSSHSDKKGLDQKLLNNIASWVPDIMKIWRALYPDEYRKWSKQSEHLWSNFFTFSVKASVEKEGLAFKDIAAQSLWEKGLLTESIKNVRSVHNSEEDVSKPRKM